MLTLQSASSREWPARSTVSLILNRSDGTLLTPIDWIGQRNISGRNEGDRLLGFGIAKFRNATIASLINLKCSSIDLKLSNLPIQASLIVTVQSYEFVVQHIGVLVQCQLIRHLPALIQLIVFGNLVLIVHENFEPEFFFGIIIIALAMLQLQIYRETQNL